MSYKTEQEEFWASRFGEEYAKRNRGDQLLASNLAMFSAVLRSTNKVQSVMEFGANIGMNLHAIRQLLPDADLFAVEINDAAADELVRWGAATVYRRSILGFAGDRTWDLVLSKGLLIHVAPEELADAYRVLYESARSYVCIAEYYNPTPVEIPYRGHSERLFKRDFAGEMMDRYPSLRLVDYGFAYHRDVNFPQDDITWFLMSK